MKALVYDRYGAPDVLHFADLPKPAPKPNEVLIRVLAATVNRTDCGFLRAEPSIVRLFSGLLRPRQRTLGNELAGEVEAVGSDVTTFKVGDQVAGLIGPSFGGHAEYVCVPAHASIVLKPSQLSPLQACAIWDGPWLALSCLRSGAVGRGAELLIYGASGSIGASAVQLAKHFGAHVTAVCAGKNVELVRSLGADQVIDYTQTDFTQLDRSFDVVLDAVGKSTFAACKRLLKPGALYLSTDLGPHWQNPLLQVWTRVASDKKAGVVIPDEGRQREGIALIKQWVEAKALRPLIDRTYPFADIVDAYRYVETEQKVGSVVIDISHA